MLTGSDPEKRRNVSVTILMICYTHLPAEIYTYASQAANRKHSQTQTACQSAPDLLPLQATTLF